MEDYNYKYLKYKTKYLELKKNASELEMEQSGGDFEAEKKKLIDKLEPHTEKILFPESVIMSLKKNGLDNLCNFIKNYNSALKKIKSLNTELVTIKSWKKFSITQSYTAWTISVDFAIKNLKEYALNIMNESQNKNLLISEYLRNCNINPTSMTILLNAKNKSGKYYFNNTLYEKEKIEKFLPRCLTFDNNTPGRESMHKLDA
jgi:hypothetical protein